MPIYTYKCDCGLILDERRPVEDRNLPVRCRSCGALALRHFEPGAVLLVVPEHFRHTGSDYLPEKGDSAWGNMGRDSSQTHAKPARTLKEFVKQGG